MDRIDDFKVTPSAQLTVEQFHLHDFDVEFDPPSYTRGVKKAKKNEKNENNDDGNDENEDSDEDSVASEDDKDGEIFVVGGVKMRKIIIKGVEVNVPLPQDKKKR